MKIIEALKGVKVLRKKQSDLIKKIAQNCALMSFNDPPYGETQAKMVAGWVQGIEGLSKQILAMSIQLQKTNLNTLVTIELEGVAVEKTIAEWILRRRYLAQADLQAWNTLTDRGLQDKVLPGTGEAKDQRATVVRFFDPAIRDAKVVALAEEPAIIDAKLEVVNATTDLLD